MNGRAGLLELRQEWLRVETVTRPDRWWDVVLVIDGSYSPAADKAELVAYFQALLDEEMGARR